MVDSPITAMLERLTEAVFWRANQAKTPPPAAPKATKEAKEINNVVLSVLLFFIIIAKYVALRHGLRLPNNGNLVMDFAVG